jgi:hypothetical protein
LLNVVLKEGNMFRHALWGAAVVSASIVGTAQAQSLPAPNSSFAPPQPVQQAGCPNCPGGAAGAAVVPYSASAGMALPGRGYPQLNAPLYPSPVQSTQPWSGGTIVTNQAFAPHEMLYPHKYHAMYPPFYHRVKGHWIWTPFGMRQHEQWKLQGTEVMVNYRSTYPPFSGFHPKF